MDKSRSVACVSDGAMTGVGRARLGSIVGPSLRRSGSAEIRRRPTVDGLGFRPAADPALPTGTAALASRSATLVEDRITAFYQRVTAEESFKRNLSILAQRAEADELARKNSWSYPLGGILICGCGKP